VILRDQFYYGVKPTQEQQEGEDVTEEQKK